MALIYKVLFPSISTFETPPHRAVGGGWEDHQGPALGPPRALHGQAWRRGVSVCGDPRPARPGTMGVGDEPAGLGLCPVVSVPRPLAGRTEAPGGQAEAWDTPRVRVWRREPPPPTGVGAVGGQRLSVWDRHLGSGGDRLLGAVLPSDVWALASRAAAGAFFRSPRAGRPMAKKGGSDGTCAHGRAGASSSEGCQHSPVRQPSTAKSRLSYRKLKL
jgi:hypothetical protein